MLRGSIAEAMMKVGFKVTKVLSGFCGICQQDVSVSQHQCSSRNDCRDFGCLPLSKVQSQLEAPTKTSSASQER